MIISQELTKGEVLKITVAVYQCIFIGYPMTTHVWFSLVVYLKCIKFSSLWFTTFSVWKYVLILQASSIMAAYADSGIFGFQVAAHSDDMASVSRYDYHFDNSTVLCRDGSVWKMFTSGGRQCKTVPIPGLCALVHWKQTWTFHFHNIVMKVAKFTKYEMKACNFFIFCVCSQYFKFSFSYMSCKRDLGYKVVTKTW